MINYDNPNDRFEDAEDVDQDQDDDDDDDDDNLNDNEEDMVRQEERLREGQRRVMEAVEQEELQFARICDAIGKNDPTVTEFDAVDASPPGYIRLLGAALVGNTHVELITLFLYNYYFDGMHYDERQLSALLQYLRTSTALRRVDIMGGDMECVQVVVRALSESLYLEQLYLMYRPEEMDEIPNPDVAHLIRSTSSSVTELSMPLTDDHDIAMAFVSNRTIQHLILEFDSSTENLNGRFFSTYVIQSPVPSLLTELTISNRTEEADTMQSLQLDTALSTFLRTAAPSLQLLHMMCMVYDEKRMELFFNGIRHHPSLNQLLLHNCIYNDAATLRFVEFWQNDHNTSIENLNDDDGTDVQRERQQYNIKFLHITGDVRDDERNVLTDTTSDATNMAQVLALSLQKSCLLEHVLWELARRPHETAVFWNTSSENANEIWLSSLQLDCHEQEGYDAMLRCIPKLLYLREFECTSHYQSNQRVRQYIYMARTNGSLYPVTHEDYCRNIGNPNPIVTRRILSYFERNEELPQLLANPRFDAGDESPGGKRETLPPPLLAPVPIYLFPQLFAAAQPAAYHAPTNILIGIVSLQNAIGPIPEMHQKRQQNRIRKRSRVE